MKVWHDLHYDGDEEVKWLKIKFLDEASGHPRYLFSLTRLIVELLERGKRLFCAGVLREEINFDRPIYRVRYVTIKNLDISMSRTGLSPR